MRLFLCLLLVSWLSLTSRSSASDLLIEAESFDDFGGWKLDTQFIETMHSPYLLAHGLGRPVAPATTQINVPTGGTYHVFARTLDWVAKFDAAPAPGTFEIAIDGNSLDQTAGNTGANWHWQPIGSVALTAGEHSLSLVDQTGFDGRCDAIYLTSDPNTVPPASTGVLSDWRREQLGLPAEDEVRSGYDLVVVGGGYAGMGAAIAAARMGCKVALIQNRDVLGGNGSSEVRVWAMGNIRRGKYSRIGEIIEEFADKASKSPGTYEEFGDDLKEAIVRAEPNIDLMLGHHVFDARTEDHQVVAVRAINTRNGSAVWIEGNLFADCTGHGTVGALAGADFEMTPDGRMGMSNMWAWAETGTPVTFPTTGWALDLDMKDFPYPRDHHGQWFWESGFDLDPIHGAEAIRDWNLRAVFGAFNAMKNRDGAADHTDAQLTWVAYIGGPRESRRLLGDVVLTQDDVIDKRAFEDGFVPSTWSIDLHYPKEQYAVKYPNNPFISKAVHGKGVDRTYGYPVPYRCFYSRNLNNLFMAGRCISVTHEALGTVRVMKTCGMMGEVVGKAASVCKLRRCLPRDVYERYLDDLITLIELPGKAHRRTVESEIIIPDDSLPRAAESGPPKGINPRKIEGLVIDEGNAILEGKWTFANGSGRTFVADGYHYTSPDSRATAVYQFQSPADGTFELAMYNFAHKNRGDRVKVDVDQGTQRTSFRINQRQSRKDSTVPIAQLNLNKNVPVTVTVHTGDSGGVVHIDALRLRPINSDEAETRSAN